MRSYKFWYLGIMLMSIAVAGAINRFDFFTGIDFNLHDTYITVAPWKIAAFLFIPIAFLVFLILSIGSKFQNLGTTWVLLVHNTLTIGAAVYLFYLAYAMMAVDALVELFRNTKSEQLIKEQLNNIILFFSLLITSLIIAEYFLIRRIQVLNKRSKSC